MPELPEVETTRRRCESWCRGHRIIEARVFEDPIVFCAQEPAFLKEKLEGQVVRELLRHGKYFWMAFDQERALLLHLGMTGALHIPSGPELTLSHGIDFEQSRWPPRFMKLELFLDCGLKLAYCDPRRFGRIRWQERPREQDPLCKLGIDPLDPHFSWEAFAQSFSRRRGLIKSALLNQRIVAGLGNWIADEVLYQSGIAPQRRIKDLEQSELRCLFDAIQSVVQHACDVEADATRFPEHWLYHRRWGKKEGSVDAQGNPLAFCDLAGRSTAWVPARQKMPRPSSVSPDYGAQQDKELRLGRS